MAPSLLLTAALGWLGSLLIEQLMRPRPMLWRRPLSAHLVHAGLYLAAVCLLLAMLQRPLFSTVLCVALLLIMVLVNNAKYQALREPFVFTDFALYSQAIRHPRLYLPYLGRLAMVGIPILTVTVFYVGMVYEDSVLEVMDGWELVAVVASGLMLAALMIGSGGRGLPSPGTEVEADVQRLGLLASLWLYHRCSRRHSDLDDSALEPHQPPALASSDSRHVVAIQSESFFDARRLHPAIRHDILSHYDRIGAQSLQRGRLQVPAWGANTMRTEFSFLSGIDSASLGPHRFNPYQTLIHQPVSTLASQLRARGYRTLCIHPYPSDFFQRSRVYPLMGFDEFIDSSEFIDAERFGPYISDAAVSAKIHDILQAANAPTFIFAITMENHGPLHLEKVDAEDERGLYTGPVEAGLEDLSVYLRHLRNADRMVAQMQKSLASQTRPGLLCFYGDHVPGMPRVFDRLDFHDDATDYFIWSSDERGDGRLQDSAAHLLPFVILDALNRRTGQPGTRAARPDA